MMKKMFVLVFCLTLLTIFGQPLRAEEIAKEGTGTYTNYYSGTYKSLAMGKERLHMIYEAWGIRVGEPNDPLHNATFYLVGALHSVNGNSTSSGFGVYTSRDGDKVYVTYESTRKAGGKSNGTASYFGGTGKLAGFEGGSEYIGTALTPASEGSFQGFTKGKAHWKIP